MHFLIIYKYLFIFCSHHHQSKGNEKMNYSIDPVAVYLFNEGKNGYAYRDMGCHRVDGDTYRFAVWAPHAQAVSLVGDFNGWSWTQHRMEPLGSTGVWQIEVGHLHAETLYKYYILDMHGQAVMRTDPFAFASELRPGTASKIADDEEYAWNDAAWMEKRTDTSPENQPIAIYEMHLGSWRGVKNYRDIAHELVDYIVDMGYTHVEFMPLSEYPLDRSWGYQVTGYYSVTARYGCAQDLMYLVDVLHQHNIGVIMDWVPGHFPKDAHGLANYDGAACFEHPNPKMAETEWGTLQFDYSKGEVVSFLMSNAVFWLDRFHIDGLRVDAVSSMLYLGYCKADAQDLKNEQGGSENLNAIAFFHRISELIHRDFPHILLCAEEATAFPRVTASPSQNGLGFSHKWNMGWMHDTLDYMEMDALDRRFHQNRMTFSMMYAFHERFILPISHDEVVHGKKSLLDKMSGDYEQKFASMRAFYAWMFAHPGKKLTFMGIEIGQFIEWRYDEPLEWKLLAYEKHRQLQACIRAIHHLYRNHPALFQIEDRWEGFEWLAARDEESSILAFARMSESIEGERESILCVYNFTPVMRENYRIGVPNAGRYDVLLNTDDKAFGGKGNVSVLTIQSEPVAGERHENSIVMTLPGLSGIYLRYQKRSITKPSLSLE